MEKLPGYDTWKLSDTDQQGYNYVDLDECYYCGLEEDDDRTMGQIYEKDINKTVLVCGSCLKLIAKGKL